MCNPCGSWPRKSRRSWQCECCWAAYCGHAGAREFLVVDLDPVRRCLVARSAGCRIDDPPDVQLLDIGLPGLTGIEATPRVSQRCNRAGRSAVPGEVALRLWRVGTDLRAEVTGSQGSAARHLSRPRGRKQQTSAGRRERVSRTPVNNQPRGINDVRYFKSLRPLHR